MANFKIFQDTPSQAKIQIFGSNTDTALNTDLAGNLGITSEGLAITAPANGLTVTASADGLSITAPIGGLSITSPANGLTVTAPAEGLSITAPIGGLSITSPANGLTVTAPAEGLSITPPANGLLVTGSVATAIGTTEVITAVNNNNDTNGGPAAEHMTALTETFTYAVVNNSSDNAQVVARLEMSPDAINWVTQAGPTTINPASMATFVSAIFLKYARIYYNAVNASSAVTLAIYFQGQT